MTSSAPDERWLVTGACGQLGAHVMDELRRDASKETVLGIGLRACSSHGRVVVADVTATDVLASILDDFAPTRIVHCAAVSSPERAQAEPERTWTLSVDVTRQLAEFAACSGGWMLFPSTDFVWDGSATRLYREDDVPYPRTTYGQAKLAGERAVLDLRAGTAARFSLLYGLPVCPRRTRWVDIYEALELGEPVQVYDDEFRTPLSLRNAARIAVRLARTGHRGVIHVGGPDVLTPGALVERLAAQLGVEARLRHVHRAHVPTAIARPRNVALDASSLRALLGNDSWGAEALC